jgi:hypothetical protein
MLNIDGSAVFRLLTAFAFPVMVLFAELHVRTALAVTIASDPKGFEGIPWGAAFKETPDFVVVESTPRIKGYELKQGPPPLGPARVDSMRFLTIDGKFARVVVRYQGQQTHEQLLAFLERKYGLLDRTPGQFAEKMRAYQFNWRGSYTQVNLTYDRKTNRGTIFFESTELAPAFLEGAGGT